MGFKWFNAGRRAGAPEVAGEGASANSAQLAQLDNAPHEDDAGTPTQLGRTPMDAVVGWMERVPFAAQQRVFTIGLVVGLLALLTSVYLRSEERRVGKECRL